MKEVHESRAELGKGFLVKWTHDRLSHHQECIIERATNFVDDLDVSFCGWIPRQRVNSRPGQQVFTEGDANPP